MGEGRLVWRYRNPREKPEPATYIGKAADTQAGFAANSEIGIKVFIEGSQVKATGYRLYLFYP